MNQTNPFNQGQAMNGQAMNAYAFAADQMAQTARQAAHQSAGIAHPKPPVIEQVTERLRALVDRLGNLKGSAWALGDRALGSEQSGVGALAGSVELPKPSGASFELNGLLDAAEATLADAEAGVRRLGAFV